MCAYTYIYIYMIIYIYIHRSIYIYIYSYPNPLKGTRATFWVQYLVMPWRESKFCLKFMPWLRKKIHAAIVKSLVPYEKIGILMTSIPRWSHDHLDMVLNWHSPWIIRTKTCGYLWIDDSPELNLYFYPLVMTNSSPWKDTHHAINR